MFLVLFVMFASRAPFPPLKSVPSRHREVRRCTIVKGGTTVDFPASRNVPRRREFFAMNIESFSQRRTHYADYACLHPRMPNDSIRECSEIRETQVSVSSKFFEKSINKYFIIITRHEYLPAFLRRSKLHEWTAAKFLRDVFLTLRHDMLK